MLVFNTTVVYADIHGGSSGSLDDPTKLYPALFDENGNFKPPAGQELFNHLILGDKTGSALAPILSTLSSFLDGYDNSNGQGISVETNNGGSTVHFHGSFIDELNAALQDKVHALDGYYLFEPANSSLSASIPILKSNFSSIYKDNEKKLSFIQSDSFNKKLESFYKEGSTACVFTYFHNSDDSLRSRFPYYITNYDAGFDHNNYLYLSGGSLMLYRASSNQSEFFTSRYFFVSDYDGFGNTTGIRYTEMFDCIKNSMDYAIGSPFRIFYSLQDLKNYLNKGKQRIYVPKLPSGGFKVNIKYINNTTNLPDITYNITTENKTEIEIQNQYDTTINNYLNGLDDFTDGGGGSTTNPTPTPSGGGSGGDLGDGTTPTPKPDFSDGSLTDTNTLLQKILDKLTEFSTNHDKLAKTITDYIEKNDGKLEEILIAIQALSDGKTETEQNGCKYDFTVLSKYLTDLWNNSDKKFDEMVKLLEENNKYQQKLVDSLNEIKALLIADTVMDFFKDRSQETAEKAKDKFPTSIPWDVSLVLNSMSAEPKNPKFSLPIKIESFKINETIDIDLSTGEWEKLAKTCRYILSVTFILFLIHLSRKLFSNGGDD